MCGTQLINGIAYLVISLCVHIFEFFSFIKNEKEYHEV